MASQREEPVSTKPYYPVGNTPPTDVTLGCRVPKQCDILLLGCGDIRNVLYTTHVLQQNGTLRTSDHLMNFHLNDNEVGVITRDLILLNIVKTVNPDDEADMKFLWSVWYDVLMSKDHRDRLLGVITSLTKHKSGDQSIIFGSEETELTVKNCLALWSKETHGTEEVIENRRQYQMVKHTVKDENLPTMTVASRLIYQYRVFQSERLRDRYTQEVREYTETGTTRINASNMSQKQILATFCVNKTFFPPDSNAWTVPDDSSPFMCFDVERELERYDGAEVNVATISFEQLKQWIKSFQASEKRCRIQIYLWLKDAKTLCQTTLPEDLRFDFIDTSNLADEFGLMPLLAYCQEKLKDDSGVLRTETFDWYKSLSHGEHFLRLCADIPCLMYPTVFGLHLAEDLDIGQEQVLAVGFFEGINKITFRWKKAGRFTPCILTGSDAISSCLETIQSPKPLQSTAVYQPVKPTLFDDNSRDKIIQRVKKVTKGQSSVSKSAGPDIPEEVVIVEYNDRYEVQIPSPVDKSQGSLNLKHMDLDERTVRFQIATGRVIHFSTTLQFSCSVSIRDKSLTYSVKRGLIKGTLIKIKGMSLSEAVLPWKQMTSNEIHALPDYPTSAFSIMTLRSKLLWLYPGNANVPAVDQDKPYPLQQLQDILVYLLEVAPVDEKVRVVCVPRRNPLGRSPLEEYQSTIVLHGHKLWEQQPATFVTVYNHDEALKLIKEGKMTQFDFMRDIGDISKAQVLNDKLLQGCDILTKILEINSCRVKQDSKDCKWKLRSFVRGRYPFKSGNAYVKETELLPKYTEDGFWKGPLAPMQFMNELLKTTRMAGMTSQEGWNVFDAVRSNCKSVCACCGKMTDCKMCTACKSVYYCSRSCQRKAWPQHKKQCNTK